MAARDAWLVAACFLAMGAVVLGTAAACMVERAQPTVVEAPEQARLQAFDVPMYNIAVFGPDSEVDYE